jgi:hypothetical protein
MRIILTFSALHCGIMRAARSVRLPLFFVKFMSLGPQKLRITLGGLTRTDIMSHQIMLNVT